MNDDDFVRQTVPLRVIHTAYENCVQARQEYIASHGFEVNSKGAEGYFHQQLHKAVMSYFEALYPLLENQRHVQDYWEEETLWTERRPKTDDDGNLIIEDEQLVYEDVPVNGLQQLKTWYRQKEVQTKTVRGDLGVRKITTEESQLLSVDVLFRAARLMDEAIDDLGLFVETKTPVAGLDEAVV